MKETCHFVSNVYDRLRFQKHAILAVLELFAADTEGNPIKLTNGIEINNVATPPTLTVANNFF